MATLVFLSTLLLATTTPTAQALTTGPTTTLPLTISARPTATQTICPSQVHALALPNRARYVCPGIIFGHDRTDENDVSHASCCIGGLFVPGTPTTRWDYAHTGTQLPSSVVTPTTCVRAVALTASDYEAQIAVATADVRPVAAAQQAPLVTAVAGQTVDVLGDAGRIAFVTSTPVVGGKSFPAAATSQAAQAEFVFQGAAAGRTVASAGSGVALVAAFLGAVAASLWA